MVACCLIAGIRSPKQFRCATDHVWINEAFFLRPTANALATKHEGLPLMLPLATNIILCCICSNRRSYPRYRQIDADPALTTVVSELQIDVVGIIYLRRSGTTWRRRHRSAVPALVIAWRLRRCQGKSMYKLLWTDFLDCRLRHR